MSFGAVNSPSVIGRFNGKYCYEIISGFALK